MATQTIKQSAAAGGRFRLTTLVTMATFIGGVLQVLRRKLNSVAVTRARRQENDVMCAASAQPEKSRESIPEVTKGNEPSLDDILKIVRISQETPTVVESYGRRRRIVDSHEVLDELNIVHRRPKIHYI